MPRDPRKHQKALMKKRSKQKAALQQRLVHQMIYEAIDYAAQFGFQPEKDFAISQYMLAPRGELEEPYHLTFGKDGKPFFIAGPHDNVTSILRQLDKTAGPGNYHFLAPIGMP